MAVKSKCAKVFTFVDKCAYFCTGVSYISPVINCLSLGKLAVDTLRAGRYNMSALIDKCRRFVTEPIVRQKIKENQK